jgi:hypothetical protein
MSKIPQKFHDSYTSPSFKKRFVIILIIYNRKLLFKFENFDLFTLFKKLFRHTGRTLKNFPPWWQYYFSFLRGACTIEICFYSAFVTG